jgi:predicted Fe-S protein YdhL (DUF1289 family)
MNKRKEVKSVIIKVKETTRDVLCVGSVREAKEYLYSTNLTNESKDRIWEELMGYRRPYIMRKVVSLWRNV